MVKLTELSNEANIAININNASVSEISGSGLSLSIFCRGIDTEAFGKIVRWAENNGVCDLVLNDCNITDDMFSDLLQSNLASALNAIDLRDNLLTKKITRVLAKSPQLSGLRELDLSENYITGTGIIHALELIEIKFPSLTHIGISCTGMGKKSYQYLLSTEGLDRFKKIDISQPDVSKSLLNKLLNRYGDKIIL